MQIDESANSMAVKHQGRPSFWSRRVKAEVLKRMAEITVGYLVWRDGDEQYSFGDPAHPLHAEVDILDAESYHSMAFGGSIGAGEAYFLKQWDTPDLSATLALMAANIHLWDKMDNALTAVATWGHWAWHRLRPNSKTGSKRNILAHYDIGNDFYQLFLDETMLYSSAVFEGDMTLHEAQLNKMKAICDQLELKAGEHLVEIGTGWGALAIYAAQNYGVKVTTTTISDAQHAHTAALIKQHGLEDQITLLKDDYRDLNGKFDKLVSIEMIEAVGERYLSTFFTTCSNLLKPTGKMLIQAITIPDQRYDSYRKSTDFIQRYIFPGGFLPSPARMANDIANKTDMMITGWRDIGLDYAITLDRWSRALELRKSELPAHGLDEHFYRMWQFYFRYCEAGFNRRLISTVHMICDKPLCKAL